MPAIRLEEVAEALAELDEEGVVKLVKELLSSGVDPVEVLEACRRGMEIVGSRFERGEYFLSEILYATDIFRRILELVKPRIRRRAEPIGRVVIGTVYGDVHNIGKDIVAELLRADGFEVIDLGVDVPPEKFVEAVRRYEPDIVGLSGLLTTSIESMKRTVEALREAGLRSRVKVVIGGGRVDEKVAEYVGADAWAADAVKGVEH